MKALVYLGPATKAQEERPKPEITRPTLGPLSTETGMVKLLDAFDVIIAMKEGAILISFIYAEGAGVGAAPAGQEINLPRRSERTVGIQSHSRDFPFSPLTDATRPKRRGQTAGLRNYG
ncbi:MAG: hypothetical protein AABM64_17620 [Pseudomonadota bacterium]